MNPFSAVTIAVLALMMRVPAIRGQPTCPTGFQYVATRRQCLPTHTRGLPIRSVTVTGAGTGSSTLASALLDFRPDTYVTASTTQSTILKANLGKLYTVQGARIDYQNLSGSPVTVSILDSTGATVGTATLAATGKQTWTAIPLLKTVGTGTNGKRVPVDKTFQVKIAKATGTAGLVRVSDVWFGGGSTLSDALKGGKISWGLAVVVDFTNGKLEDYTSTQAPLAINNVLDLRTILNQMESHWSYVSMGKHRIEWSIQRIKLNAAYVANAYNNDWVQFRDALAAQLVNQTRSNIGDYDTNSDGIMDHAWFVLSSKGVDGGDGYFFSVGGRSMHLGVDMFVDGQGAYAVTDNCIGCFNHEVSHTDAVGLGDIYGDYDNLGETTIMSYPWGANPGGFLAAELLKLGYIDVVRISSDVTELCLSPMEAALSPYPYRAVVIETGVPDEYFMAEYRKRPTSGWGSGWDFAADGILITHVLTTGSNGAGPNPYLRIEPADGNLPYGQWPNAGDLWDNTTGLRPFNGTLYSGTRVFTVSKFVRPSNDTLCFDVSFV